MIELVLMKRLLRVRSRGPGVVLSLLVVATSCCKRDNAGPRDVPATESTSTTEPGAEPTPTSEIPPGLVQGRLPPKAPTGFYPAKLTVGGVSRDVTVYFPPKLAPNPPLILAFHGTGGTAEDGVWDTAANETADAQGVLVISLQARRMPQGDWDNHEPGQVYFETYPHTTIDNNNDLQLVLATIVEAERAYGVDPKRIYTAGFSNGAFFAQFAAMALADRIAGFASSAGGLVRCPQTGSCSFVGQATDCGALAGESGWCSCSGAEKPVPLRNLTQKPAAYIAHSVRDGTVSSYYSCALSERLQSLGHPVSLALRTTGEHESPPHFMPEAWKFLSRHPLK